MGTKTKKITFTKSSGNVFKDLGFPNAEEMLAKAKLASSINEIIKKRKLTQQQAAEILGLSQPNVSLLSRGILEDFSLERLLHLFNRLNQDVQIVLRINTHRKIGEKHGHISVVYA